MHRVSISVIVPIFNSAQVLPKCIESVLSQSFSDFELLLINDGSTDNSAEICEKYAQEDERIRVFNNENHGVSYSRNFGILNSRGKYIMFLDSDDFVDKDWCRLHYEAIQEHPTAWIVSGINEILPNGNIDKLCLADDGETVTLEKSDYYRVFKARLSGFSVNHIYSRQLLGDIRYEYTMNCGEDVVFNNAYLQRCDNIIVMNNLLYNYVRGTGESLSTKYDSKYFDIHRSLYESRKQFVSGEYMPEFCKTYFSIFTTALKITFDKRNKDGFLAKLRYNNSILRNPSFIECMENADLSGESPRYIRLLRSKRYLRIYILGRLAAIKKRMR